MITIQCLNYCPGLVNRDAISYIYIYMYKTHADNIIYIYIYSLVRRLILFVCIASHRRRRRTAVDSISFIIVVKNMIINEMRVYNIVNRV